MRTSAASAGSSRSSARTATSAPAQDDLTWFASVSPKPCAKSSAATMNATDTATAMPAATSLPDALRRFDNAMRIIVHHRPEWGWAGW